MVNLKKMNSSGSGPILRSLLLLWGSGVVFFMLFFLLERKYLLVTHSVSVFAILLFFLFISISLAYWFYQNAEWKFSELRLDYELQVEAERNKYFHEQKLQSLGRLGAGVAHEINNPLAVIKTRNSLMQKKLSQLGITDSDLLKNQVTIDKQVNRISSIIKSLQQLTLDTSRESSSIVPLKQTLDTVLEYLQERPSSQLISIDISAISDQQTVYARPTELVQIFYNLLGNSIDAIATRSNPWIKVFYHVDPTSGFINIRIQDCGGPLGPDILSKLFEPFYTTKEIGQGTGLGLSLCRQMAQSQGGELSYDSLAPTTTFILRLPLRPPV